MATLTVRDASNVTQTLTEPTFDSFGNLNVNPAPLASGIDTIDVTKINGVLPSFDSTILQTSPYHANGVGNGQVQPAVQYNFTLLGLGAQTATFQSAVQQNPSNSGMYLCINVTAAGTSTLTPSVRLNMPTSLNIVMKTFAAISGTGLYLYWISPVAVTNAAFTDFSAVPVPPQWIVKILAGDASSWTYGIYVAYLK